MPRPVHGTFNGYPELVDLPRLVRKQRRLEAQLVPYAVLVIKEAAVRASIDELLLKAGLKKSDVVTCAGYDVRHNERAGHRRIVAEILRAHDVPQFVIDWATQVGEPALFATVKPSKGSHVRAPRVRPSRKTAA